MTNGVRIETVRVSRSAGITDSGFRYDGTYKGRIAIYEDGKRRWSETCGVERISRGDAKADAERMASDFHYRQFFATAERTPDRWINGIS